MSFLRTAGCVAGEGARAPRFRAPACRADREAGGPGTRSISRDLKVEPGLLTELPILVGVLALELGSALGLVPVQAVSGSKSAMGQ